MTVVINGTTGIDTGTGSLIAADATTPTYLDLFEDTDNGSNYVRLIAPTSIAANRTITLPDGTGTVVVNNVSSALVMGTAKVAVTDFTTSADFTNIPTWARRITIMFDGVSLSGSDQILVQLGDSGGLETTGYISGGAVTRDANTTNAGSSTSGFIIYHGAATTNFFYGTIRIESLTGNAWVASVSGTAGASGGAAANGISGGGSKTLSATLDRVSVTRTGTNTFDAGTVNIMWE